jgi:hypothetical protein
MDEFKICKELNRRLRILFQAGWFNPDEWPEYRDFETIRERLPLLPMYESTVSRTSKKRNGASSERVKCIHFSIWDIVHRLLQTPGILEQAMFLPQYNALWSREIWNGNLAAESPLFTLASVSVNSQEFELGCNVQYTRNDGQHRLGRLLRMFVKSAHSTVFEKPAPVSAKANLDLYTATSPVNIVVVIRPYVVNMAHGDRQLFADWDKEDVLESATQLTRCIHVVNEKTYATMTKVLVIAIVNVHQRRVNCDASPSYVRSVLGSAK